MNDGRESTVGGHRVQGADLWVRLRHLRGERDRVRGSLFFTATSQSCRTFKEIGTLTLTLSRR